MMIVNHRHEQGFSFASLTAMTLFMLIGGLILNTAIGKNIFTNRQTHRLLIREQSAWLAQSAIEHALADLQSSSSHRVNAQFAIRLAPVFIHSELMAIGDIQSDIMSTSIEAYYRYHIESAEHFRELTPNAVDWVLITGQGDVPYRRTHIIETVTRLGYRTPDGVWKSLPITTHP